MRVLLDTHFVVWLTAGSERLAGFRWLERYRPWGVSPFTLLEVQYLAEVGRLAVESPGFYDALAADRRFLIDEAPLVPLVRHALGLDWTRDPFDRLLVAHSSCRRTPLVTLDRTIREHHPLLVPELPA